jgi:simple sugar transport system ATP-binding protein
VKGIKKAFKKGIMLPFKIMSKLATILVENYDVRTPTIETPAKNLSGGNQQKVLLARELSKNPKLIVASQPTRGVDIGVMEKVHDELIKMRNEGVGILLVSSDLDEVLKMSDYILVMYEGEIVGKGPVDSFSLLEISQLMTTGRIEGTSGKKQHDEEQIKGE